MRRSHSLTHLLTHSLRGSSIAMIGTGTMGQALIKGLLAHGTPRRALAAADPNPRMRREVGRRFHLSVDEDNVRVVRRSAVVILAVKPQQFPDVIGQLAPHLTRRQLVISIAAGITLRWLAARLPGAPLVRVMPNLPATVGCGWSALALGGSATVRHRALAAEIFGAVGEVVALPERSFDAVTAVSGSGPAYVLFLVDAWEQAARTLGLPAPVARRAVYQTLEGSVRLLRAADLSASALIGKVASKGGTTEAALKVLAARHAARHITDAVRAAAKRSRALSCS